MRIKNETLAFYARLAFHAQFRIADPCPVFPPVSGPHGCVMGVFLVAPMIFLKKPDDDIHEWLAVSVVYHISLLLIGS